MASKSRPAAPMLDECHFFADSASVFLNSGFFASRSISAMALSASFTFIAAADSSRVAHMRLKFDIFGPYTIGTPIAAQSIGVWPPSFGGRDLPIKAISAIWVSVRSSPVVSARYASVSAGARRDLLRTQCGISFINSSMCARLSAWRGDEQETAVYAFFPQLRGRLQEHFLFARPC